MSWAYVSLHARLIVPFKRNRFSKIIFTPPTTKFNIISRTIFTPDSFGTDIDYIPASKIISSWLYYANRTGSEANQPLHVPLEAAHVEIIFQHENSPTTEWIPLCGYDSKATFEPTWRTDLCITENLLENITRCICPLSGTFVVLLAKKNYNLARCYTAIRFASSHWVMS
uniref:Uncharacterized protein n=1 Tax=Anopheles stephensi TaxID=30069 RepID=A0A182YDF2_ANOST